MYKSMFVVIHETPKGVTRGTSILCVLYIMFETTIIVLVWDVYCFNWLFTSVLITPLKLQDRHGNKYSLYYEILMKT